MNSKIVYLFILSLLICTCREEDEIPVLPDEKCLGASFESISDLMEELNSLKNDEEAEALLDCLSDNDQIPFISDDSVLFIYYGQVNSVSWAGDFNGWDPSNSAYQGQKVGENNLWILKKSFPSEARLDYKIVLNGSNWILDPRNSFIQVSGFGANSELRMPDWEYPEETIARDDVIKGNISDNILISSIPSNLGYDVNYKVYTPYNYASLDSLAVVYFTDGHEYADSDLGAAVNVLDNLIYDGEIEPLLAVFIDPRDPNNSSINRRLSEYAGNPDFANFVADELVSEIDENYKTIKNPGARGIVGTSFGGRNSAYFGLLRNDVFQKIIIHSPALNQQIIDDYQNRPKLPLDIFMSTGVIYDTEDYARSLKSVLESKNYNLQYIEVNEGHSWGNWRALIDEPLKFLFEKE